MEKRQINSIGTITIPKHMRDELGISGMAMLRLDVRERSNGIKEIVMRKDDDLDEILNRYKNLSEILSRIAECTVAVVWNNNILSMTSNKMTESFLGKNIIIDHTFSLELKKMKDDCVIVMNPGNLHILPNNHGDVLSYYKIPDTGDDRGYFVVLNGTKLDSETKISKAEMTRRFYIIADIVKTQIKV